MINFRKISDGQYPVSFAQIQQENPQTYFPPGVNLEDFGYEQVSPTLPPSYNQHTQQPIELQPVKREDGKWIQNWQIIDIPFTQEKLSQLKQQKKEQITNYRYTKETSGFSFNGLDIKTDIESQAKVNAAFVSLQAGFVTEIDWKAKNGWVKLKLPEITALATAIAGHVKACFTKEKELNELVDTIDNIDELEQFDINIEWNK